MSFEAEVLQILQEVGDKALAAKLIAALHDSIELARRRDQASLGAAGRWRDADRTAEHSAPKRAELHAAATQGTEQRELPLSGGKGGHSELLPFRESPEPSKPKISNKQIDPLEGFPAFWVAYPRKVAPAAARRAWRRHRPSLDVVLAALAWQVKSAQWSKDGGEYIPHPSTYINQHRWEDEPRNGSNGHYGYFRAPHPGEHDYPEGEQKL